MKISAQRKVANAVRDGKLNRPDKCQKCGSKKSKIQAHHPDYTKPLEVEWLCTKCHAQEHLNSGRYKPRTIEPKLYRSKPIPPIFTPRLGTEPRFAIRLLSNIARRYGYALIPIKGSHVEILEGLIKVMQENPES
jgi:ribosomal protein S27AE